MMIYDVDAIRWRQSAHAQNDLARPWLDAWSVRQAEHVEITGYARADYERELRISALGNLVCATCSTPLWRRVCCREMYREIRARSADQRVAMELVIAESLRS